MPCKIVFNVFVRQRLFKARVDRFLPYDFHIEQTPGRTLGIADYLSRHPSYCEGSIIQSEEIFKDWFTVKVVDKFTNELKRTVLARRNGPIKSRESVNRTRKTCKRVLTL